MRQLPPLPSHIRMPTDIEIAFHGIPPRRACRTCGCAPNDPPERRRFRMWSAEPLTSEIVEFECPCDNQLILRRWLSVRGVQARHQHLRLADLVGLIEHQDVWNEILSVRSQLKQRVRRGIGVAIYGRPQTGKTSLAYLFARHLMADGSFDVWCVSGMSINDLDWKRPDTVEWWNSKIRSAEVLIVDDLTRVKKNGFHEEKVDELIGHRYDSMLATIITTPAKDLTTRFGSTTGTGVEMRPDGEGRVALHAMRAASLMENNCVQLHIPPTVGSFAERLKTINNSEIAEGIYRPAVLA